MNPMTRPLPLLAFLLALGPAACAKEDPTPTNLDAGAVVDGGTAGGTDAGADGGELP